MTVDESNLDLQQLGIEVPSEEKYLFCIRCGLCLSVCPTYKYSLRETESPRGRVALVRKALEGELELSVNFADHVHRCLGCLACDDICPVGIKPAHLCLETRDVLRQAKPQSWVKRLLFHEYFPHRERIEWSMLPMVLYQKIGLQAIARTLGITRLLPQQLQDMEKLLPPLPARSLRSRLPEVTAANSERKHRVGFFLGCFQNAIFAEGSAATVRVLARNGCEVITPKEVKCCGMPANGYGFRNVVRDFARHNIALFEWLDVDAIVTDCATCGSALKEYPYFLSGDAEWHERAEAFAAKVRDINEFLVEIGVEEPKGQLRARVTYHDPCHLARAQQVRSQPRELIRLSGAELVEMKDADSCCGSAGTQIVTHHETAVGILAGKIANAADTGAEIIVTSCPGCQLHLGLGVKKQGLPVRVLHPVQLLDEAYRKSEG
jgi:glycolate oxidase iron-sulfur subunit